MALTQIRQLDTEMQECVDNCSEAAQACEWCADECIRTGDEEMARCVELCRDVADLTTLNARLIVRDSEFQGDFSALCADACEACADECEQFDEDHCQLCADVLHECAESCRAMAA